MIYLVFVHTKSDVWLLWTKLLGDRRTPTFCATRLLSVILQRLARARQMGAGLADPGRLLRTARLASSAVQPSPILRAAMKADCGISTLPNWRIRFLPSFCFSRSFLLRVTSPP